ncbi:ABC transporter permease [Nocardioides mangrovi]|uniref:ABC transporter permease n=1 Tax=Nocardioides mangrovi TaxID=2874580 RepID=A0ABS7UIH5_9ACTN|nr:ABC transporter permease [Nocardioides mangrovi]MBZ5740466.1 ABC transporter permease [Nocardioides mangrovi]
MSRRPHWHGPTIAGRLRSDAPLLVLMGLVVAVTTLLTAAVGPVSDGAADRAIVAAVRDAGLDGAVVATLPRDPYGSVGFTRDPRAAEQLRRDADRARLALPPRLAAVLRAPVSTVTTPALHLLDAGPGRYLHLTYAEAPAVHYVAGGAPRPQRRTEASTTPGAPPWPVQVAVSKPVARALGIGPGDRLPAEDDQHQPIRIRISGVYVADDPGDATWQLSPDLLDPAVGVSQGVEQTTGAALVSAATLPDLQLAVPAKELAQHITFLPRPEAVGWAGSGALTQDVAHLQASADPAARGFTWSSLLGSVLTDGRAQVTAARGQAEVVVVGLVVCALLVLALAAQLLVGRRAGPVTVARERGATLLDIAGELLVESVLVAATGAALGLAAAQVLAGGIGWAWSLPVVIVAALAAPVLGAALAARSTSVRRVPANRSARRALDRARSARRLVVEATVLVVAALSLVALHQRGTAQEGGWDGVTAAAAATMCAVAGTVVAVRLVAPVLRVAQRAAHRSTHAVGLLVTARLSRTATRVLPALAVSVAVAQLTFGISLAATEHRGQETGALLAVGGDARLTAAPDPDLETVARQVAEEPGVRAAVAGRVADDVQLVSARSAASVRLVVVDAASYARLLAASPLPDVPALAGLDTGDDRVPALLLGGTPDLQGSPVLHWQDAVVPLDVVGAAPRVDAAIGPVVVVDVGALGRAGVTATPDTVWTVGPGAADALTRAGGDVGSVTTYAAELDARRDAPLASALVRLAAASSVPLLLFAVLGVVLAAAAEAPARGQSLGRLRSLGLADRDLRRVLAGEVLTTVVVATLVGLALGLGAVAATFGSLSLERITGETRTPDVVLPWWTVLVAGVVVLSALAVALSEWRRLHRRVLAELLRS